MDRDIPTITQIKNKLRKSLEVIRNYDWLLDSYVLDFYVDDHWHKLPLAWRENLENLQLEHLSELVTNNKSTRNRLWPLSLLALQQILKDLCIARETKNQLILPHSSLVEHPKLKHVFTKCVKPKKRHEVERMASFCKRSCEKTPIDFIVDFGAGLGHLARVLGYGFGIKVCCLEMQNELNKQASEIDLKLEYMANKHLSQIEIANFQRPTHVSLCLNANMQPEEFLSVIRKALHLQSDDFHFGIIGLHPCGDLGAILMRMFLNCPQAKFLNLVGCCYMKLSTAETAPTSWIHHGYPLSAYLRQHGTFAHLSYEAREISCHACETYYDRLITGNYEYLKVHSFRAAAERIITKHWPELKHSGLRSVKHTPGMQFEDYFYKAVHGIEAANLSCSALQSWTTHNDLLHWKRIVVFYTLRLMLAPLVETIILYDRILFLLENGCEVEINAIFDSRLSPRNHITSAIKCKRSIDN